MMFIFDTIDVQADNEHEFLLALGAVLGIQSLYESRHNVFAQAGRHENEIIVCVNDDDKEIYQQLSKALWHVFHELEKTNNIHPNLLEKYQDNPPKTTEASEEKHSIVLRSHDRPELSDIQEGVALAIRSIYGHDKIAIRYTYDRTTGDYIHTLTITDKKTALDVGEVIQDLKPYLKGDKTL